MTTGSPTDIFKRLKGNLVDWFGQDSPNVDALLKGVAQTDSTIYGLIGYANQQARIKTATGDALDLISLDFFGGNLPRHTGENDTSFRQRILASLFQERATRKGMYTVLLTLTGIPPVIVEGGYIGNVGTYDTTLYYDAAFGYGWLAPYTAIIYAFRPKPTGFTGFGSYDQAGFGYDYHFNNAYVDTSQEILTVTDADIIAAIQATKVYGTLMYVYIDNVFIGTY
jgi:hypothetical protein